MWAVIGQILGIIGGCLCSETKLHMAYWVDYQRYIRELGEEAGILEDMRSIIQAKVGSARNKGNVIVHGAMEWVEKVEQKLGAVTQILEVGQQQQLSWLSVVSRYELGRRAEREKEEVSELKARGDPFVSGTISHPATITCPLDTDPTKYERFRSRDDVYERIMEALRDEGDGSYKIGIGGLPGVGKTRMAFEVAKQALDAKIFDEVAKATVSQTPDFDKIRQDLADCLNLRWNTEQGSIGKAGQLGSRLKNDKRILLVLDDVWDEINLMEIGIPDNIKGCKVLITSREGGLWDQMGIRKVFEIESLLDDEAWELFRKKVGDAVDQPEIRGVPEKVCRECGGLPLVILVVGGALIGKDKRVWIDTLGRLENFKGDDIKGMKAKVYKSIELSYKYLNPDPSDQCDLTQDQKCFLHCCLFAEDADISIDDLVRYGLGTRFLHDVFTVQDARNRVYSLVDKLKVASLLLQGKGKDTVKMHDVIRDVGISIASKLEQNAFLVKTGAHRRQQKDKYDSYGTISLRSGAIGELLDEVKRPSLLTLVLAHEQLRDDDSYVLVQNNFFKGLENLEVLNLTGFDFSTPPLSLQNLVNLRMFSLTACRIVSLSLFGELHKLEILCFNDCSIEKLPTKTDSDIIKLAGKLIHLQILDFSNTEGLSVLPASFISNLSRLEELYIYEFDGWEVEGNANPLELKYLAKLSTLEIHLPDVKLLHKDLHFESLNRFKISIRCRFDYSDYGYHSSISRALKLNDIPLKVEFNTLIERAQALSFIEINGLKKVLHDKDLPDLEYLRVEQCNDMEHLLGKAKKDSQVSSASFSKLSVLKVSNCKVKYLFCGSTAKQLKQLQKLIVENCEVMEGVIGDTDHEEAMDTVVFNELKSLELKDLPKLKSICANMKHASSTDCNTSTSTTQPLFTAKVSFPALEKLNIKGLDSITVILERQLSGAWTEASQDQPPSLNKLRELTVTKNCKLKYLFSPSIARFLQSQLRRLKIEGCESMEAIIGDDEEEVTDNIIFHQLEDLELWNLPNLRSISAANTEEMSSTECSPSTITPPLVNAKSFPALETLTIWKLDSIPVIFEKQLLPIGMDESHAKLCSFSKLSDLRIYGNCTLKYLFSPSVATLLQQQLKQLHVQNCENMEALIGEDEEEIVGDIIFGQLELLELEDLPNLKSISANTRKVTSPTTALPPFNAQVSFPILEVLSIDSLDSITRFGAIISSQQLRELTVTSCEKIEELIAIESGDKGKDVFDDEALTFTQFRTIRLAKLPNLQRLFFCYDSKTKEKNKIDDHHLHGLFSNKVSFPALKSLFIKGIDCIARLELLISFQKLQKLTLTSCEKIQEIVAVEIGQRGKEAVDDEILVFTQLKKVKLENLSNLRRWLYCSLMQHEKAKSDTTHMQALFDYKFSFPALETLTIEKLDSISVIFQKQLLPIGMGDSHAKLCSFSKLSDLRVYRNCKLKYLFSPSVATLLQQQLKQLIVKDCENMEALIGEDEEEIVGDIIFGQLSWLELVDLPNLKSISANTKNMTSPTTALPLFDAKVWFPSLETLVIDGLDMITALCEMQLKPNQTGTSQDLLCSFRKLRDLTVSWNCKLKYLFSHSMARCLGQLHKLTVDHCESMEAIVGDDKVEVMDDIIFYELKTLKLKYLPNLKSILATTGKMSSTTCNPATTATTSFNAKVSFPILEVLSIDSLNSITRFGAIISSQQLRELTIISCEKIEELLAIESGDKGEEVIDDEILTFSQLQKIKLDILPNLERLFFCYDSENKAKNKMDDHHSQCLFSNKVSFPALESLFIKEIDYITRLELLISFEKLQELTLTSCEKIQEIVAIEIGQRGKEAVDDEILVFTQLKKVKLENLPNLRRCLYCSLMQHEKAKSDTTHMQALFDYKVSFPILEQLSIYGLKCIMAINRLCLVKNKAKDSFPQLEKLYVKNCENMETIVAVEAETQGGEANESVVVLFPQLKNIRLEDLPNFKSFYCSCAPKNQETLEEALFNFSYNVQAPHLEMLYIKGIDNVKEIWHSTVSIDSVSKLTELTVQNCDKLLNIGPLKLLRNLVHNLEELEIMNCPLLQDGFKIEASNAAGEDERVEKDEDGTANVESSVAFSRLNRLSLSSFDSLLPFSKGKDSFSELETLEVSGESMFEDIWEGRVPEDSFLYRVKWLKLEECSQLVDVPRVLQRFEAVENLTLTSCSSVQVVFNLQELHATERLATLSGQVKRLTLEELPKLEHVWLMKPKGGLVLFSNLTWLGIACCNNLRYLFSISIARALPQLKILSIEKCDAMEEIVMIKNEDRGEANVADEIVFPRLEDMWLFTLPELRSVCGANNAFQFPSLDVVGIKGCPKLYTFTCGPTGMPNSGIYCAIDGLETHVRDINEHVRRYAQRVRKLQPDSHRQEQR